MDINKITIELKQKFPGKKIIITDPNNPGEIICETEPTEEHPDWNACIAVIDFTRLHYHKKLTETYEILEGELDINMNGTITHLKHGEKIVIRPGTRHSATGNETWIRCSATPGWTPEDHILVFDDAEVSRKNYDAKK